MKYLDLIDMNSFSCYRLGANGNQYYYYEQPDLQQHQHQHQHPLSGHQFPSQIHPQVPHFPPHVHQAPRQLIPQAHQPLQQIIHPPQAHQPSQGISHHNLNGPPFPAHANFGPINHTSWVPHYFNPTISSPSPNSPVSSLTSPTTLSSPLHFLFPLHTQGCQHQDGHSGTCIIELPIDISSPWPSHTIKDI